MNRFKKVVLGIAAVEAMGMAIIPVSASEMAVSLTDNYFYKDALQHLDIYPQQNDYAVVSEYAQFVYRGDQAFDPFYQTSTNSNDGFGLERGRNVSQGYQAFKRGNRVLNHGYTRDVNKSYSDEQIKNTIWQTDSLGWNDSRTEYHFDWWYL